MCGGNKFGAGAALDVCAHIAPPSHAKLFLFFLLIAYVKLRPRGSPNHTYSRKSSFSSAAQLTLRLDGGYDFITGKSS